MPDPQISVEIQGLRETQQRMEQIVRDMRGERFLQAMRDATIWVTSDAKALAPVDTGQLRASITPEIRTEGTVVYGVVGSQVHYAPYMETGTRPHWPPLEALQTWARRHGTTAYAVASAIARRGNRGVRYLQRALDRNRERIIKRLGQEIEAIIR